MTTLHDRLVDLAQDAPAAGTAPGLWDRGMRYRRRRRAGTAVVLAVAVVALGVLGSVTWLRSPRAVEPLPASSPGAMPDRLYAASPWLPGTSDGGPLGRIAAVEPAIRNSWSGSESDGLVGVSAETGEYRFLDLPGLVRNAGRPAWALSPDGRYVAYLYRAAGADVWPGAATGIALYDARTGEVRSHELASPRGIRGKDVLWAGSGTVVLVYGNLDEQDGSGSRAQPVLAWDVHVAAPQVLENQPTTFDVLGTGPGFVVMNSVDGYAVVDTGTGTVLRRLGALEIGPYVGELVWAEHGSRFAFLPGGDYRGPAVVGTPATDPGGRVVFEPVPGVDDSYAVVHSWIDDEHLAVLQLADARGEPRPAVLNSVDIHTGTSKPVVTYDDAAKIGAVQVASALLGEPTVRAVEPPRPLDPRKVTGGAAAIVLAAPVALILWRRRVRP